MNWHSLVELAQIEQIIQRSNEIPCLIFKHSTRCEISAIAKYRLESDWDFSDAQLEAYYLDLIAHRSISNQIADVFEVHHESPQVLLIVQGECVFDTSHLDITVSEINEALQFNQV